jgi:hypothetical protein
MARFFLIMLIMTTFIPGLWIFSQEENIITKPIEFPTIILEGKEQLNIQSGSKQFPENINNLTKSDLDSLNPLEKQQSLLLPTKPFLTQILHPLVYNGSLFAEFGRYFERKLDASYSINLEGYRVLGAADYEGSSGFVNNSGFNKLKLLLTADYIAPLKYWIFGGSRTRFDISYDYKDYKLYASKLAPTRTSGLFHAMINSEGSYEGFSFNTGGGFKTFNMNDKNSKSNDNDLNAFLQLENAFSDYSLGGKADLHFRNFSGRSLHFINLLGIVKEKSNNRIEAGFQSVIGSDLSEHINLYLDINGEYQIDKDLTLRGRIFNGYEDINFYDFYQMNPYISDTVKIQYGNSFKVSAALYYNPTEQLTCLTSLTFIQSSNFPMFQSFDTTLFDLLYPKVSGIIFNAEVYWSFTIFDQAIFKINLNSYNNGGYRPTFIPAFISNVAWNRKWTSDFTTQFGITYTGAKFADVNNNKTIAGWTGINAFAQYSISQEFSLFAKSEKLLNSNIYIWEDYKERDLYFSVGLHWKFR